MCMGVGVVCVFLYKLILCILCTYIACSMSIIMLCLYVYVGMCVCILCMYLSLTMCLCLGHNYVYVCISIMSCLYICICHDVL